MRVCVDTIWEKALMHLLFSQLLACKTQIPLVFKYRPKAECYNGGYKWEIELSVNLWDRYRRQCVNRLISDVLPYCNIDVKSVQLYCYHSYMLQDCVLIIFLLGAYMIKETQIIISKRMFLHSEWRPSAIIAAKYNKTN